MPYLRFKGFDEEFLRQQQPLLITEFSRASGVPPELVKIELLRVTPITDTPRSLEILMFPRDQRKHDAIAERLYNRLSVLGYRDVHIFFLLLAPSRYYKEGIPLRNMEWVT